MHLKVINIINSVTYFSYSFLLFRTISEQDLITTQIQYLFISYEQYLEVEKLLVII